MDIAAGQLRREGARLLRRLVEPGHYLSPLEDVPDMAGLFGARNKWRKPVLRVDLAIVEALHRADLLTFEARGKRYRASAAGEAWWRRQAGGVEPFRAQHQLMGERVIEETGRGMVRRQVNLGEAPLGWLRRRKGPDGKPFLSEAEVEAGERLRRDYTLAQLSTRVTADWSGMLAHVDRSRTGAADPADRPAAVLDARSRVDRALRTVGPGLSDVLVATCCELAGLEQAERALGWPQRSAKIVLKIALARLAAFYGLTVADAAREPDQSA